MGSHIICIVFIVAVQFSAGLGRNHNYEYYISKYHHKSSTALSSSIAGFSPDVTTESPVSDDSLENIKHSSTGDNSVENIKLSAAADSEDTHHRNRTGHSNGNGNSNKGAEIQWIILVVSLIVLFVFGLTICCCCCVRKCRMEQKGFVLNNPERTRLLSEQSLLNRSVYSNCTDEPSQQQPTNYSYQPLLVPFYSPIPTLRLDNPVSQSATDGIPATPPPPYDAPFYQTPPRTDYS